MVPNYHIPNENGCTMQQLLSHLKPRGVPLGTLANYYNAGYSLERATQLAEITYGKKLQNPKRLRRLGLATCKHMMQRAINAQAAVLWDRATPEARDWLFSLLSPEKRSSVHLYKIPDNIPMGTVIDPPDIDENGT